MKKLPQGSFLNLKEFIYWSIISVPFGGVKLKVEAGIEALTFTLLNFT